MNLGYGSCWSWRMHLIFWGWSRKINLIKDNQLKEAWKFSWWGDTLALCSFEWLPYPSHSLRLEGKAVNLYIPVLGPMCPKFLWLTEGFHLHPSKARTSEAALPCFSEEQPFWHIMQPKYSGKNDCVFHFISPFLSATLTWLKTHYLPISMKAKDTYSKK